MTYPKIVKTLNFLDPLNREWFIEIVEVQNEERRGYEYNLFNEKLGVEFFSWFETSNRPPYDSAKTVEEAILWATITAEEWEEQ